MTEPLRLMAVLAHPDDESLGVGGTFAKYSAEGVETYLITATRGEKGRFHGLRDDPRHPGPERLASIREAELMSAASALGIRDVHILGYPDNGLDQVDPEEIVPRIARHIRRVRPHVITTFGPDGAYGHPDHVAICQFATAAAIVAADGHRAGETGAPESHSVSKLYYMASNAQEWQAYQEAFKKLSSTVDGVERFPNPWPDWEITTEIDTRAYWPTIWRAVSCHESQVSSYEKLRNLSPEGHEALWGCERYYRVFSTVNGGRRRETDLFEGLRS